MNFKLFIVETENNTFAKRIAISAEAVYEDWLSVDVKNPASIKAIYEVADISGVMEGHEPLVVPVCK
jgi:hypothetical protein